MNDIINTKPFIVGLTGGIGSGKSAISNALRQKQFSVYDSDSAAQSVMQTVPAVRQQIITHFGPDSYQGTTLNRKGLAAQVFDNPARLQTLNQIVHPAVKEHLQAWINEHQQEDLLFVESAILFESGFCTLCNKTVCISAPEEIRIERVIKRDACTIEAVKLRMQRQMDDTERQALSDIILCNDGQQSLEKLTSNLLNMLSEEIKKLPLRSFS